jgi:pilus assembly protein CpaE
MAVHLIVASAEPRFLDFVREQAGHFPGASVLSEHEEMGPNLHVRILQDLMAEPAAAVILDIASDAEHGHRVLEHITQSLPGTYVILSDSQYSAESLLALMRMGSSDFILQPLKRADFHEVLTRLDQHRHRAGQAGHQIGRMYSFVGVKGGVGATTAAINFAAICARQGMSTVLLDLDFDSGDAASFLGLHHQYSVVDVAENLAQLDRAMLEGIMARDALGFFVICAPHEQEKSRFITEDHIREIGSFLIERYDAVIVDGSRDMDPILQSCLELSETIFLVLTQEFAAVRNTQHYLNALVRFGYATEAVKLLLNRHDKRRRLNVSPEQLQQTLGSAPFWGFPNQYEEAVTALHEGRPVVMKGNTELGKSYRNFAKKLGIGKEEPAVARK